MHIPAAHTPWHRDRTPETCAQPVFCVVLLCDGVLRIAFADAALCIFLFMNGACQIENK